MRHSRILMTLVVSSLALAGCSTGRDNTYVTPSPTPADFMAKTPEERDNTLERINYEGQEVERLNDTLYQNGRPVQYGNSRTGYTVQWAKRAGQIMFFPGHSTGTFGMESSAILTVAADHDGTPLLRNGQVVVLSASASHQEAIGRFIANGAFRVLGAAANGVLAAQIHASAACKDCGGGDITLNNGASAGASSESASNANATGTANADSSSGGFYKPKDFGF